MSTTNLQCHQLMVNVATVGKNERCESGPGWKKTKSDHWDDGMILHSPREWILVQQLKKVSRQSMEQVICACL